MIGGGGAASATARKERPRSGKGASWRFGRHRAGFRAGGVRERGRPRSPAARGRAPQLTCHCELTPPALPFLAGAHGFSTGISATPYMHSVYVYVYSHATHRFSCLSFAYVYRASFEVDARARRPRRRYVEPICKQLNLTPTPPRIRRTRGRVLPARPKQPTEETRPACRHGTRDEPKYVSSVDARVPSPKAMSQTHGTTDHPIGATHSSRNLNRVVAALLLRRDPPPNSSMREPDGPRRKPAPKDPTSWWARETHTHPPGGSTNRTAPATTELGPFDGLVRLKGQGSSARRSRSSR